MVIIPLEKKLRKKLHRQIALAQDILVDEIYKFFPKAVLHGGTAIWRCFKSNRFSEDLDFYLPSFSRAKFNLFLKDISSLGFTKLKFKNTEEALFSKFAYEGAIVRFEAVRKAFKDCRTMPFEMLDGTSIIVNTLSPDILLKEKVHSYLGRRKVRDLYDIFFLLKFLEKDDKTKKILKDFLKQYLPPKDKGDLKAIIIIGAVPKIEDMLEEIKKWAQ